MDEPNRKREEYLRQAAEYDSRVAEGAERRKKYEAQKEEYARWQIKQGQVDVSIVVLTHDHPDVFCRLLDSLPIATAAVPYELVVVDNGSAPESVELLKRYQRTGAITTLILEAVNHFFSEGNNIGVRNSNPKSKYILLLNSDVEILHPLWLARMVEWMEGVPETYMAHTWSTAPTVPSAGPRDVVSYGWSYTQDVPGCARPEGWCCMIRRSAWREISPDFPFYHGFEEMVASILQEPGRRAGVLFNYSRYVHHYEGGCEAWKIKDQIVNKRTPDERGWFAGCNPPETLDFTLGSREHFSYCEW